MNIDIVTQYILAIVPAVTAIMSMVVLVGVGIGKIRKANQITESKVDELTKSNKTIIEQNNALKKENIELKQILSSLGEDIKKSVPMQRAVTKAQEHRKKK